MGKYDEKKAWLLRYEEAKKDLETLDMQYRELVVVQESTGAIEYHATSGGGSGENKDLSAYMVKREKIIEKYLRARYKKLQIGIEIQNAINALPSAEERKLMTMRYMLGKKWEDVCVEMHMSWTQAVNNLHGKALGNLIIPDNKKSE